MLRLVGVSWRAWSLRGSRNWRQVGGGTLGLVSEIWKVSKIYLSWIFLIVLSESVDSDCRNVTLEMKLTSVPLWLCETAVQVVGSGCLHLSKGQGIFISSNSACHNYRVLGRVRLKTGPFDGELSKMGSCQWSPIQQDWCLCRKNWDPDRYRGVTIWWHREWQPLQDKEYGLRRDQACPHLDLGLAAFRPVRNALPLLSHPDVVYVMAAWAATHQVMKGYDRGESDGENMTF